MSEHKPPQSEWTPIARIRWYRPKGGNDNDVVLQQLFSYRMPPRENETFSTVVQEWVTVPTVLED